MKVALIELRRRPGRFAPALIALVLLTMLLLVLGGLLDGLYNGSTGALRAQPGDLLTYSADAKLSLVRSRITASTVAEVSQVPGVEEVGGLGVGLLGAKVPDQTAEASVVLFGYELAPRGVPSPPQQLGDVYADRSLEASGVALGQTLLLGPEQYPVTVVGWVSDTNYLLQGGLWGNVDTWRAGLASARPDAVARSRHLPGPHGGDGGRGRPERGRGGHRLLHRRGHPHGHPFRGGGLAARAQAAALDVQRHHLHDVLRGRAGGRACSSPC